MALLLHDVYAGDGTLHHDVIIFNFTWNYLIIIYIYYYHTNIMQISIYVINNMPEPGRNLAADACIGRAQLSPCIYNFSTSTIRASRYAMSAWYFFHAEPLISRFSLEIYIPLLQQLWQTVLVWNLYPIFILLNQLAVKITPAESFLWMHLHQFQYLFCIDIRWSSSPDYEAPVFNAQTHNHGRKWKGCASGGEWIAELVWLNLMLAPIIKICM